MIAIVALGCCRFPIAVDCLITLSPGTPEPSLTEHLGSASETISDRIIIHLSQLPLSTALQHSLLSAAFRHIAKRGIDNWRRQLSILLLSPQAHIFSFLLEGGAGSEVLLIRVEFSPAWITQTCDIVPPSVDSIQAAISHQEQQRQIRSDRGRPVCGGKQSVDLNRSTLLPSASTPFLSLRS